MSKLSRTRKTKKQQMEVESFECPAKLRQTAFLEWKKIVADLLPRGLLQPTDAPLLAVYCNAYAIWQEATIAVETYGSVIKSDSGFPVQSPYISIMNHQADTMMRLASEFGLTPKSRARMPEPPSERDENESVLIDLKPLNF